MLIKLGFSAEGRLIDRPREIQKAMQNFKKEMKDGEPVAVRLVGYSKLQNPI